MLTSDVAGEKYIEETIRFWKVWILDSPLKTTALKTIHVIQALLLPKPSRTSKSQYHLTSLETRGKKEIQIVWYIKKKLFTNG